MTAQSNTAFFHLPGLFEFYDFYRVFLPVFRSHRDWFYENIAIASLYGAPADCLWGGGRVSCATAKSEEVLAMTEEYGISARLTLSNSLLRPEHLSDPRCNALCGRFAAGREPNGVIVHSELLTEHLRQSFPELYLVSSTTRVLTRFCDLKRELERPEFRYVVPDFRLNPALRDFDALPEELKEKVELLCNECCFFGCAERRECYESVSRLNLGEEGAEHVCRAPGGSEGYRFSGAMENPGFISAEAVFSTWLPMGVTNFKIEGRGLGSALLLEFILYYLTRPEHRLRLREELYLTNTLDLF